MGYPVARRSAVRLPRDRSKRIIPKVSMGCAEVNPGAWLVSNRYTRLMDLMGRPQGCRVEEACVELGVTRAGCRGMIRDLKALVPVETEYDRQGGRGRGRSAVHFIRTSSFVPGVAAGGGIPGGRKSPRRVS